MARPQTPGFVTFPVHVERDVWERFKQRAEREGRSAHGLLKEFIEKYGGRPSRQRPMTARSRRDQ